MDIVCIVLGVIDLNKPSLILSICTIGAGLIEAIGLAKAKSDGGIAWLAAIFAIAVGTIKICTM